MGNLTYHKGLFCIYSSIFCQEGYCSSCEIYHREQLPVTTSVHHSRIRDNRKLQEAGVGIKVSFIK